MQDIDFKHAHNLFHVLDKPKKKYGISRRSELENMYLTIYPESEENQIEKAYKRGTKVVCDLLVDGEINPETAHNIIEHFVEMYVEYKVEKTIQSFLEKHDKRFFDNALSAYIEDKEYGKRRKSTTR